MKLSMMVPVGKMGLLKDPCFMLLNGSSGLFLCGWGSEDHPESCMTLRHVWHQIKHSRSGNGRDSQLIHGARYESSFCTWNIYCYVLPATTRIQTRKDPGSQVEFVTVSKDVISISGCVGVELCMSNKGILNKWIGVFRENSLCLRLLCHCALSFVLCVGTAGREWNPATADQLK